jgi:glutathionylspermidine synthase
MQQSNSEFNQAKFNSPEFNSPQRQRLFRSLGMPWYNLCPINADGVPETDKQTPYALYHCHRVAPQMIQEIQRASEQVGQVFSALQPMIRALDASTLLSYGFPKESIRLIKYDPLAPFCMRLDWCWNEATGTKKIIETNCQTPSFWFECTTGNREVARHFGLSDPTPLAESRLGLSLDQHLQRAARQLSKSIDDCHIGFTALNNPEDMGTMKWLKEHCDYDSMVFPLEFLRIKDGKYLFCERSGRPIDILFMWYPLEWAIHDVDEQGRALWPALEALILERKLVIVNFASAFALQPKSILALITDLGLDAFSDDEAAAIVDYFPQTALTPDSFPASYFAKPILGRQGEGGFAVDAGETKARSGNNSPWYTQQDYVYQELLDFPQISVANQSLTALWGVWLYNDGSDRFAAGGVGLRVSEGTITDDYSYWCPIGC